jgi:NTP pyrophosphatase (non-canonical NTP hydrolase)
LKNDERFVMKKFAMKDLLVAKNEEILLITQEECAEVTQAISKVFRFGMEDTFNGISNREHLEEEVGDLLCMIDLLIDSGMLDETSVMAARSAKLNKLKKWTGIFKEVA